MHAYMCLNVMDLCQRHYLFMNICLYLTILMCGHSSAHKLLLVLHVFFFPFPFSNKGPQLSSTAALRGVGLGLRACLAADYQCPLLVWQSKGLETSAL